MALLDEQIAGCPDVQKDGDIDHFFCHWQYQRKGVGKALMHTLIQTGKANDISRLYAQVSITAKPFFEHFGFQVIKQQVENRDEILTNYIMEKSI